MGHAFQYQLYGLGIFESAHFQIIFLGSRKKDKDPSYQNISVKGLTSSLETIEMHAIHYDDIKQIENSFQKAQNVNTTNR